MHPRNEMPQTKRVPCRRRGGWSWMALPVTVLLPAVFLLAVLLPAVFLPAVLLAVDPAAGGSHGASGEPAILVPPNVWAIVSFAIVAVVLLWKVLPPIRDVMDKRAQTIREALEAAEKARAQQQALVASHAAEMKRSRDEILALMDQGKAEALRARESILAEARKESEAMAVRARREIEQAKNSAIGDLQRQAVDLALDLAGRLIRKNLNPAEQQDLIQDRIRNLPPA